MLPVDVDGFVKVDSLEDAIKENTCLISIMTANNETGVINNISQLGKIAHKHGVPFHSDTVQIFGKLPINPSKNNIDAFSVSFHKLNGPIGAGLLVISKDLISNYDLRAFISGSQNDEMRGGTENIAAIAGAFKAFKVTMEKRTEKNEKLLRLKKYMMTEISRHVETAYHTDAPICAGDDPRVIWITPKDLSHVLPNTLLLSVCRANFCNLACQSALERLGIIVSIGSACNSSVKHESHVVKAMKISPKLYGGILRISMTDYTTKSEIDKFVIAFIKIIHSESCLGARPTSR
jgi:cysteine desulfurase